MAEKTKKELEGSVAEATKAVEALREKVKATPNGNALDALKVELGAAEASLAEAERALADSRESGNGFKVKTTMRFGAAIPGESSCAFALRGADVKVKMLDGVPYWASAPISDSDLESAGFVR